MRYIFDLGCHFLLSKFSLEISENLSANSGIKFIIFQPQSSIPKPNDRAEGELKIAERPE